MSASMSTDSHANEAVLLRERIHELTAELRSTRREVRTERDRREQAEEGREVWAGIATTMGIKPQETHDLTDRTQAMRAAQADALRAQRRQQGVEDQLRARDQIISGLLQTVRALRSLPVPVPQMHPDAVAALLWAFSERGFAHCSTIQRDHELPKAEYDHLVVAHRRTQELLAECQGRTPR